MIQQTKRDRIHRIDWSLYAIIDKEWLKGRSASIITEKMIRGGAGIIQFRDKKSETGDMITIAMEIRDVAVQSGIPVIINDRVDVALAVEADGVHLGQKDMTVELARKIIGEDMIIGASVSNLLEFEKVKSADYLGVGAIYQTETKNNIEAEGIDLIRMIRSSTAVPLVGIGGIKLNNLAQVIQTGCDGIAAISALLSSDDIEKEARLFYRASRNAKRLMPKNHIGYFNND